MSARLEFKVIVSTASDWSIGIGSGRQGSIDRLIARDADDLPYMPATTLRGLWRDAAEQLAFALDGGASGGWTSLLPHLFGSQPALDDPALAAAPSPSLLQTADARMSEAERAYLRHEDSAPLRAALVYVRPGVAIDPASGTARTEFLRFEEVAREGIVLEAKCAVALPGGDADAALAALAIGALRLVERMGGKRRRGAGRCAIGVQVTARPPGVPSSFAKGAFAAAADVLKNAPPAIAAQGGAAATRSVSYRAQAAGSWRRHSLKVELRSAVVVPHDVLGNVITTLDFIPGTMLLPIVARMLAGALDPGVISTRIANGDIRVLPAYPSVKELGARDEDGRAHLLPRPLPTPCVWERKKDDTGGSDGKGELRNGFVQKSNDGKQWKSEREGYVAFAGSEKIPVFAAIRKSVRTHNSVDDLRQKPTEEAGGVYSYESLNAGQIFLSELWIRDEIAGNLNVTKIAGEEGRIGRAKNAGYGLVHLSLGPLLESPDPKSLDEKKEGTFFLLAASDIVLRFGNGGKPLTALLEAIKNEYDIDAELAKDEQSSGAKDDLTSGVLRFRRHEGWIARWNLQRPSLIAIKAGSALKLQLLKPDDSGLTKLAALQNGGLGERRGEGFGHVLVNHPALTRPIKPQMHLTNDENPQKPRPAPPASFNEMRELLETEAAKVAIRLAAEARTIEELQRLFRFGSDSPTMSQLGALRATIGDLSTEDQLTAGRHYLDSRKGDGGAWTNATWQLLQTPGSVWDHFTQNRGVDLFAFAQNPDGLAGRADLRRYAIASLFHAAMRAHKRALERPERGESAPAAAAE